MLHSNNLNGSLSSVDFTPLMKGNLQTLALSDNKLTGKVPDSIFQNGRVLHSLFVDSLDADHRMTGKLPENFGELGGLPNLKHMSFNNHNLTGKLPKSLGKLNCTVSYVTDTNVACDIWLEGNDFDGDVPHELCDAKWNEIYLGHGNDKLNCSSLPCIPAQYASAPDDCDYKNGAGDCVKC